MIIRVFFEEDGDSFFFDVPEGTNTLDVQVGEELVVMADETELKPTQIS